MRTICWSVKGGSGTTVAATALALLAGRRAGVPATLVDLAGDVSAVLGLPAEEVGLHDWLASSESVDTAALEALVVDAGPTLRVLPGARDTGPVRAARLSALTSWLRGPAGPVVVDLGVRAQRDPVATAVLEAADRSLLVTRPCYLSLRRLVDAPYRPTGVVLLREEGRALDEADVEAAAGAPVVAVIDVQPSIAKAVDAGLLNHRLPRPLARALRGAA